MNEYAMLLYGVLIGYGIAVLVHRMFKRRYDWLVLILVYIVLLLLSLKVPLL